MNLQTFIHTIDQVREEVCIGATLL